MPVSISGKGLPHISYSININNNIGIRHIWNPHNLTKFSMIYFRSRRLWISIPVTENKDDSKRKSLNLNLKCKKSKLTILGKETSVGFIYLLGSGLKHEVPEPVQFLFRKAEQLSGLRK